MRMMAKIWLLVLLLTLVVGGCRRAPGEAERRLMAIDSLIAAQPDSALALLAAVDTATLAEPDRAYHALLQTQAMYKAYIPATDSTLICRAQRYYADHGPVDRQIRTMRYRASVAEDLGDPELAMRWYKRTELAARDNGDDYNTGYALMSMGVLYQTNFEDSIAVERYRLSLEFTPDSCHTIRKFCYYQLSQLYQLRNNSDSALFFIGSLKELTRQTHDTTMTAFALSSESGKWFYDSCYQKSKDIAVYAINHYTEFIPYICWNYAIQSYALLGMTDSADYYLNMSPPASNAVDSTQFLHSKSLICELKNQWKEAHRMEVMSDSLSEAIMWIAERPKLYPVERQTAALVQQENDRFSSSLKYTVILVVLLVFFSTLIYLLVRLYSKRKDLIEHAKWLEADRLQLTSLQDMQSVALKSTQAKLDEQILETKRLQEITKKAEQHVQQLESELNARQSSVKNLTGSQNEAGQDTQLAQSDSEFLHLLYSQLSVAFESVLKSFGDMAKDFSIYSNNADIFVKKFQKRMQNRLNSDEFWERIENYINQTRGNALKKIYAEHTELNDNERKLIMLTMLHFDHQAIAVCIGYNGTKVVSTIKSRLKKKMGIKDDLEQYLSTLADSDTTM